MLNEDFLFCFNSPVSTHFQPLPSQAVCLFTEQETTWTTPSFLLPQKTDVPCSELFYCILSSFICQQYPLGFCRHSSLATCRVPLNPGCRNAVLLFIFPSQSNLSPNWFGYVLSLTTLLWKSVSISGWFRNLEWGMGDRGQLLCIQMKM